MSEPGLPEPATAASVTAASVTGAPVTAEPATAAMPAPILAAVLAAVLATPIVACSGVKQPVPVASVLAAGPADRSAAMVPDSVAEAWRAELGASLLTPLLAAGPALLAGTGNGTVLAVSTATGERFWKRNVAGAVAGALVRDGARLVLAAGRDGGRVYALRLRDGGRLWEREVGGTSQPPALHGDTIFLGAAGGAIRALDARTGRELWETRVTGRPATPPLARGAWVVVATTADTLYRLDRATGVTIGSVALPAGVSAPPAWSGDRLYLPLYSGELLAYDLARMAERWRAALGAPILAAPVVAADGAVYALTRNADVWRIGPDGAAERIARTGGAARGSLTLADGRLLVGRLDGTLLALRPDGHVVWEKRLGDSIVAPVTVSGRAIYVPLLRGTVVKLEGVR